MAKRLIVFSDGTWKSGDDDHPSNVHRLWSLVGDEGSDGVPQRCFYQAGVGTDPTRGGWNRTMDRVVGGAFGRGLDRNILEAYDWLVQEYEPGDELWFFGFSRGAYTVRSLVGLIRNCGVLRRRFAQLSGRAMDLYRARQPEAHPDAPRSRSFRANYSHDVKEVRFLGVWDTVGARGIPGWMGLPAALVNRRFRFHDTQLSSMVKNAYQALAVDERRRSFEPAVWTAGARGFAGTVEQWWCRGVHSDVGGGYAERGLSDLTLDWMLQRARVLGLGYDGSAATEIKPDAEGVVHDSRWFVHRVPPASWMATRWREIVPGNNQAVHPGAADRTRDQPENVKKALAAGMPVGGGAAKRKPVRAARRGEPALKPTR